ncbi:alpha-2-macroglobulin family protein [Aureispira anguillae]|uniref:MG2 domain-containing protein n=1 Tax=Aureispira anguillae TaxID=2864201 RepID=A0A915YM16_9BACT|nr:MG2 domain-containing protein [Aureispira anguillae]BDS15397.1 MG2 domain-containing protein [Aureispira anguillae]
MRHYCTILSLLLLLGITACQPKENTPTEGNGITSFNEPNAQYKFYVSAYTSGMISATSAIRVRFANDIVSAQKIGSAVSDDLLSFEPAIKGSAIWEDRQTVLFTPEEWLPAGQYYSAKANLTKVYPDISRELATLDFDFKIIQQGYEVDIRGLREQSLTDLSKMRLLGTVRTYDAAIPSQVEQMLNIKQSDNSTGTFTVSWEHSGNNKTHNFIIEGVKSFEEGSELQLSWNGESIGVKEQVVENKIEVPSTEFEIISAKVIQEKNDKEPYVLVLFSLPLQQTQNLDGLISIDNYRNRDYNGRSNFRQVIDGNELRVYPLNHIEGDRTLRVSAGIRSINQTAIPKISEWPISFNRIKPAVRLVGNGVIIPKTKGLYFPFEATKLRAIQVEIFKIYEDNVLQFLQSGELDYTYSMRHVGRVIAQKRLALEQLNPESNQKGWVRYGINLDDIVKEEEGAIYQVRIGFSKKDAIWDCSDAQETEMIAVDNEPERNEEGEIVSIRTLADRNYSYYNYEKRKDPCYDQYYTSSRIVARNVLGSNLGILAKRGKDKELFVAVTDLKTTEPVRSATVEVYDKVLQRMAKVSTDEDGIIRTKTEYRPAYVVVSNQNQKGYLRLQDAESLSLSKFETSGTNDYKGLKGQIYGERGVWRPGDSLFLTFVLEDKRKEFPAAHPITFELYDTRGNLHQKYTTNKNVYGMYDFRTKTSSDAGTGYWSAKVHVGGTTFYKGIRIETVKPNRLKIDFNLGKDKLLASDSELAGDLSVKWLHGAPASNLQTQIDVKLSPVTTRFEAYEGYQFDDPARASYYDLPMTIFASNVDENGKAKVRGKLELAKEPSGFMRAGFTIRAYEKGGDASSDNFSIPYSPYASYVGIKSPKGKYDKSLDLNIDNDIAVVVVDENGQPLKNKTVSIGVYKVKWNWWWDRNNEISNFNTSKHLGALKTATVTTNAKGEAIWKFAPKEWGRYMIRVADQGSGHCSGIIFHAGSPWDDENFNDKQGATMLAFSADKESYEVGEEVVLEVPAGAAGRALLTLENGFSVVDHQWVTIKNENGVQKIKFTTKKGMAPTIYAHVTLLQPHEQVENDLPIRSYGVLPIKVIDPKTKLMPILDMADVLEPNSKVRIKVSEENKQAMTYTIAMVDEGLLDLTRFKTPDLWEHFYQKEALGVKTWDMYNYVLGAYELNQLLAIGGGADVDEDSKKANRFKPVVRFIGPFHLKKGQTVEHTLDMPNYVGSVRTMIVAAEAGAYGKNEKTTPVRKPLMVLGTLPRVLSPTEQVKLPVTVFAMEEQIKEVEVTIETNDLFKIQGAKKKRIQFDRIGDAIVNFDLLVADKLGIAKVNIKVKSGGEEATYAVELDVRNPNPYTNKVHQLVLDGGKQWDLDIEPIGMEGTNKAQLEISTLPPIDLAKRLDYLIRYPYGCIEQTTSSVFPQLYVANLMNLEPFMEKEIEENIRAAIKRLQDFQTGLGGFAYWQGGTDNNDWGTNYAGHFLLEAKTKGYAVPKRLLDNWKRYQKTLAKNWQPRVINPNSPNVYNNRYAYQQEALMQAYRLYTLALANSPDLGSMNKMRNAKNVPAKAKWRLAATYALLGKREVAKQLVQGLPTKVAAYRELSYTYGSSLRDEAMILETLTLLKNRTAGANVLLQMSKELSSPKWLATQTVAYSLMAIAKFAGGEKLAKEIPFAYQIGGKGKKEAVIKKAPIVQYSIDVDAADQRKIMVKNKAKTPLFASVIMTGQPPLNDTKADASNIELKVTYKTMNGEEIDPINLAQGTNFVAYVDITHKGINGNYDEMALHQVFPAGWEIINTRMNEAYDNSGSSRMDYQNVLDDRVYTYFDLPMGKTYHYKFYLNAAYQGRFYMPNVSCSAMYDNSIYANTAGKWVTVTAPKTTL